MTQNEKNEILRAFDELADLVVTLQENTWDNMDVWDVYNRARISIVNARAEVATMLNKLLLPRD